MFGGRPAHAAVPVPGAVSLRGTEHPPCPRVEGPRSAEPRCCRAGGRSTGRGSASAVPLPTPWRCQTLGCGGVNPPWYAQLHTEHPSFLSPLHRKTEPGLTSASVSSHSTWNGKPALQQPLEKGCRGARSRAGSTRRRRAPASVAGLYKPGLDEAQGQALLPDSHPEMPREQPRLGYCSTSLLPSPAKEKQQEKHLTSPLPALGLPDGGNAVGIWDWDGQTAHPCLCLPKWIRCAAGCCQPGCRARLRASLAARLGTVPKSCSVSPQPPAAAVPVWLSWCPPAALACPAKAA